MGLLHLLVAALAAGAASAADPCGCFKPDQKIDPINNPMIFFQQPTEGGVQNGVPCATDCTLIAHAADEATDGLVIQILTNSLGKAKITVIDGPRTFLITSNTQQKDITWKSTGGVLQFNFEGAGVSPVGLFMIVVSKSNSGRDPLPSVIPTTTGVPTPAYDSLKYNNNPLLVANDIMINIDLSSDNIDDLKAFATELIKTLTITNASDCGVGTRLALFGLTSIKGFVGTYIPNWQYQTDSALGNIASMSQIGKGPFYIQPVQDMVNNGFRDNIEPMAKDEPDRCLNRGRIYLLLTSNQPYEWQPSQPNNGLDDNMIVDFISRGVHPIIVSTLKDDQKGYYEQYKTLPASSKPYNRWSYFNIDKGVTEFLNSYLVDNIPDMTCQQPMDTKVTLKSTSKGATIYDTEQISIPPYYEGMFPGGNEEQDWDKIKHYCNFQSTSISIEQATGDLATNLSDVCLKVYYDLETDRDFVTIYGGDYLSGTQREIVKLTGRDVSGSTFRLNSTLGSIVFSSDEKNVYDGFYAEITPCGKAL